jgi:hypothetical protein
MEIETFNKKVVTRAFNRVVCAELAQHIDPTLDEKTLIFCATDNHADIVVDALKKALEARYGDVDDDAVLKITGAADKPQQLIRRFRNERLPNIAVTVDLLTTGIDVPKIANLHSSCLQPHPVRADAGPRHASVSRDRQKSVPHLRRGGPLCGAGEPDHHAPGGRRSRHQLRPVDRRSHPP